MKHGPLIALIFLKCIHCVSLVIYLARVCSQIVALEKEEKKHKSFWLILSNPTRLHLCRELLWQQNGRHGNLTLTFWEILLSLSSHYNCETPLWLSETESSVSSSSLQGPPEPTTPQCPPAACRDPLSQQRLSVLQQPAGTPWANNTSVSSSSLQETPEPTTPQFPPAACRDLLRYGVTGQVTPTV